MLRHLRYGSPVAVCAMATAPLAEAALHAAAVAHLARYATTQAGLLRVLNRRIDRWARTQEEPEAELIATARAAARIVVGKLAVQGLIDDGAFAASRARKLIRGGRSRQAIAAHLAARGVARETSSLALPEDADAEFAAAIICTKRRRIGPFRRAEVDTEGRNRELAMLARAGFPRDIALRALACLPDEADSIINALRQP